MDNTSWARIVSIEFERYDFFFDLTVPESENYLAEGIWHHNSGKTRGGTEWAMQHLRKYGPKARFCAAGQTIGDARDVLAEGDSGIITLYRDEFTIGGRLRYNRSLGEAWHRDGGYIKFMGAEEPERFNGPQWTGAWADELYGWMKEAWEQLQFGVRLDLPDDHPRIIITTTPKGSKLVREVEADETTAMTHGRMEDNPHLSERRRKKLYRMYGKTRLGKAELEGEYYEGVEGALWNTEMFRYVDYSDSLLNRMVQVGVGVDPATTSNKRSNETGIACVGRDGHRDEIGRLYPFFYVFYLEAHKLAPLGWAKKAVDVYDEFDANFIVGETNNGGDMVESNIHTVEPSVPFHKVTASRGKFARAEEWALVYDQRRVFHVKHPKHDLARAEERLCAFVDSEDNDGDDEVDAGTWIGKKLNAFGQPAEDPQIVATRDELTEYKVY